MSFALASQDWEGDGVIYIVSPSQQAIAAFPVEFLRHGSVNTWTYILDVVHKLVLETGFIRLPNTESSPADGVPQPGTYEFLPRDGEAVVRFSDGPEYFRRDVAPNPAGSVSTRSDSKRSTANQSQFRVALIARDYSCLVSDVDYDVCTACHIVPQSRPDTWTAADCAAVGLVYQSLMSIPAPFSPPMFRPSCGLLLEDALHHAFDRLELSFYFANGVYHVHFFLLRYPGAQRFHGNTLAAERFRGPPKNRPDPQLLEWHYKQCIKARFRGFAVQSDRLTDN